MSLERNVLERKLKLARKELREKQAAYDLLQRQTKSALEDLMRSSHALADLQREKNKILQMEDDLAGKRGPLVELSKGTYTLEYVSSSEPWPDTFKNVRIRLNPLGDPNRSSNIDLRENGRFGDDFTDDDAAEVLLALPKIDGGEAAVAFFMSWKKT